VADPLPLSLLPDTAEVSPDGHLSIGGVDLQALAEEFGTPLFVYDEAHLRDRCRQAVDVFGDGVAFASKAFMCTAMAKLAHEEGMHIDVATGGELHVALHAGVPAANLVMHGNNKSMVELEAALATGVGRIVVDSFDEMDRLDMIHARTGQVASVLLRLTPGVEAHTHEFIATGQDDSKFGFTVSLGYAEQAIQRAVASPAMDFLGIHAHIGSQVFSQDAFRQAVEVIAGIANSLEVREMSVGGGLGVPYVAGEEAPTVGQWGRMVLQACSAAGVTAKVLAEPGRSIVAAAALTLYQVGTIKALEGIRTYVAVNGGMSDNPRPVLYGSGYETFLPRATTAERPMPIRLVGKHCESGDILVREGWVPDDIRVGDLLATPVTGAYGYSLASNYNMVPRPPVVFVADGKARLVRRRETFEDLLALDG